MRSYEEADAQAVLAINAECVPEVGEMDEEKLAYFVGAAGLFLVETSDDDAVVGFLIGLDETATEYGSNNYAFFRGRNDEFGYVDRIAITEAGRGKGIGQSFYNAFEAWTYGHGKRILAAEVNTVPDNPPSHRFHLAFGFTEVERANPYGGEEEVAYYEKAL